METAIKDKTITTVNPVNGQEIGHYEYYSDSKAEEVIESCHQAFSKWRHVSLNDRAEKIKAIGEGLKENRKELAELMTAEMGKLL